MITLEELQNKELDALIPLAKELGVKKPASDKEDLIYQMLDAQAENFASNAPQREPRERRGRKSPQPTDADDSQPKKRGRKPKTAEAVVPTEQPADDAQPKKRGRKPKKDAESVDETLSDANTSGQNISEDNINVASQQSQEKRRRGRPRRSEQIGNAQEESSEDKNDVTPAKKITLARTVSSGLTLASRRKPAAQPKAQDAGNNTTSEVIAGDENVNMAIATVAVVENTDAEPVKEVKEIETVVEPVSETVENKIIEEKTETADKDSDFVNFFPKKDNGSRFGIKKTQESSQKNATPSPLRQDAPVSIQEPGAGNQSGMRKAKHQQQTQAFDFNGLIECSGVLEVMPEGHGFLRSADFNYMPSPDDVYLTREQIRASHIKTGDVVECTLRAPRENDKYFPMARLLRVNGRSPEFIRDRVPFEHLTPLFPDEKFDLTGGRTCNISTRVVDMFSPIGKGQRGLIVAPPKTGKTILLKDIANAIAENHPETYIMILLIDERPEEVTDMIRSVNAEVIASTFDEPADRHVRIANIVLEKAKRMVECGHDVVILLDSITRLARAYNTVTPTSSKILSGGVDANALQKPKRFFGAARNIENGGSLTIIATALTETSSKMDEVIFEEFKGTGNMELQLDRKLSNKRIFPAVDIMASSTRRDDLLLRPETQNRMWILRRFLSDRNSIEAMEFIKDRMERTTDNDELLRTMNE